MPIRLYLDHHVPRAILLALRIGGVDVLTALEDAATEFSDSELLTRASALGRVLFSQDDDLLREAVRRQRANVAFAGVIYAHQLRVAIGVCVSDLTLIAQAAEPEDLSNRIQYLPL